MNFNLQRNVNKFMIFTIVLKFIHQLKKNKMFENVIMLKNRRKSNDKFNKQFHYYNNYIMINSTIIIIIIIKNITIKVIIAINLHILVFRQIINETINISNMIKKVTITIFNFDIKTFNQLINKILFQLINNNVLLKHFLRSKQHDKNLHKMHLFYFRRQFIITSSKKNILKRKTIMKKLLNTKIINNIIKKTISSKRRD